MRKRFVINDSKYKSGIIKLLIKKLATHTPPGQVKLHSSLDEDFYTAFKTYLRVGSLTLEELDELTGYSMKFINERIRGIEHSGLLPLKAIDEALRDLKAATKESLWARKKRRSYYISPLANEYPAHDIRATAYYSTLTPFLKNLDELLGLQRLNSEHALSKFFEDALIGYSIARCEAHLIKQKNDLRGLNIRLPRVKALFVNQTAYKDVLEKLADHLSEVKGRLTIIQMKRRTKSGAMVSEVAGLLQFLEEKDMLSAEYTIEQKSNVFIAEFRLKENRPTRNAFKPSALGANKKKIGWETRWKS
jgi:hypothetical protein